MRTIINRKRNLPQSKLKIEHKKSKEKNNKKMSSGFFFKDEKPHGTFIQKFSLT